MHMGPCPGCWQRKAASGVASKKKKVEPSSKSHSKKMPEGRGTQGSCHKKEEPDLFRGKKSEAPGKEERLSYPELSANQNLHNSV